MKIQNATTSLGNVSYRSLGQGSRKVLFFHGFPGSSSQIGLFYSFADKHDFEVLCFDRPGYHHTNIKTENMLQDTIQIAKELVQQKNWTSFEVVVVSGGTPYGISLALQMPEMVSKVRVICGLGYLRHPKIGKHFSKKSFLGLSLLPHIPGVVITKAILASTQTGPVTKRAKLMEYFFPTSHADNECLAVSDRVNILNQNLHEALTQNALGPKQDAKVFLSDWGKNLAHLKIPIYFWHGDEDVIIPDKVSEEMAKFFDNSYYSLVKKEGHLSLPILRTEQIMLFEKN